MKNTMDFYNKTASDWAEKGYNSPPDVPSMYDFAKEYPQGSRFLDLCCGCGYETMRLHALGYTFVDRPRLQLFGSSYIIESMEFFLRRRGGEAARIGRADPQSAQGRFPGEPGDPLFPRRAMKGKTIRR